MIVTLVGFKPVTFTDKKDNRNVSFVTLNCLIDESEHKDNSHEGAKFFTFNTTRNKVDDLEIGCLYEVITSELKPVTKDGKTHYESKPLFLRPID